ncbi:MAG: hypothetical protein ACFFCW_23005 [Candidatus Hodarchaeota archaeon]
MTRYLMLIITFLLFSICSVSTKANAQDVSTVVFNVYVQSALYPESFDDYVEENQRLFNQRFLTCLNVLFMRYGQRAREHADYCNGFADPKMRSDCMARNEAATVGMWCLSLAATLDGTPWLQTFSGNQAYTAKQIGDALFGPGGYVSLNESLLQMLRPIFQCE